MLYKGKALCPKCGEFEWQIAEGERGMFIGGFGFITKHVATYDKKTNLVITKCPSCGKRIEIEYCFKNK